MKWISQPGSAQNAPFSQQHAGFRGENTQGGGSALGVAKKDGSWRDSESLGEFGVTARGLVESFIARGTTRG